MALIDLSENERRVLLSVMRYPENSDTELAKAMGMNLYTFNKVKNSLLKRRLLIKSYIPNYNQFGFELMIFTYGSNMDSFLDPFHRRDLITGFEKSIPARFIFKMMEMHQGLGIHAVENFTSLKRGLMFKRDLINTLGIEIGSMTHVKFSFADTTLKRFFDMFPILNNVYGEEFDLPEIDPESPAQETAATPWQDFFSKSGISEEEEPGSLNREVMIKAVTDPQGSDQKISREIGVSRYKIRRAKDDLFSGRMLKTSYIPNIKGFGYEVILFTHIKFRRGGPIDDFFSSMKNHDIPEMIHLVYDGLEGCGMGLFNNLSEASAAYQNLQTRLEGMRAIERSPYLQLFSVANSLPDYPFNFSQPLIHKGSWNVDWDFIKRIREE